MALYLPIGPPASGKSHLVKVLVGECLLSRGAVLSTDEIRHKLTGDPMDQSANSIVFGIAEDVIEQRLLRDLDVWYDATNLLPSWRSKAVEIAGWYERRVVSILMTANDATCRERNANRRSPVPDDVMNAMFEHRRQIRVSDLPGRVMTDHEFFAEFHQPHTESE